MTRVSSAVNRAGTVGPEALGCCTLSWSLRHVRDLWVLQGLGTVGSGCCDAVEMSMVMPVCFQGTCRPWGCERFHLMMPLLLPSQIKLLVLPGCLVRLLVAGGIRRH